MLQHAKKALSAVAVLALTLLILPAAADAQTPEQQQQSAERPDTEELTDFVHAMLDVNDIQEDMEEQLAGVNDPEQANQIQQQANAQMVEALEEHEMTPERYSEIAMLLNVDEELNAEFQEIHEAVLEERDGANRSL